MDVLVSGASGFLGRKLIARLIGHSHNVIAIARCDVLDEFKHNSNVLWLNRDLVIDDLTQNELPHIDTVVHLAGATLGAGKDENLFLQANEQTTVRLLQALAPHVNRFIYSSSQVVYGDACHLSVTEDFPLLADNSAYACSKLNSELWLRWFQKQHGGQYLSLRLCGFIDGGGFIDYVIAKAIAEDTIQLFSNGKICRDYISSTKAIDVIMSSIQYSGEPSFIPINIGSGQIFSAYELATFVCTELRSNSQIELLTTPAPQNNFVFSIDRAINMLNFEPGNLLDDIRQYIRHKVNYDEK